MTLRLFNTMTKKKELFKPLKGKQVKMFVCGVTVYDYTHLGHARTYSFYDTLVRFLRYSGYKVTYLQNVTDVGHLTEDTGEDKVEKKAKTEKKHPLEIANFYLEKHLQATDRLNLLRPDIIARATDYIPEIIKQVQTIIKNEYAYVANGSVYFDVSKFKDYGKLSKKVPDELKAGARVEINLDKTDPSDFTLWINATRGHILGWSSPWSEWGYPGWHIEDTAIALKYFSSQYDIHGGAIELAFPHHEAEIAQAEATTKIKPYVKYWVHTGLLTINKQKMAKSLGNFIRVIDALDKHSPETLRLWIASSHYRKPLDYNEKDLEVARRKVEKIRTTLGRIRESHNKAGKKSSSSKIKRLRKDFLDAMSDDINTPFALTKYFELITLVNKQLDKNQFSKNDLKLAEETIAEFGDLFQIIPLTKKIELPKGALGLIKKREAARKIGDFARADEMRNELKEKYGVVIEDTKDGVKWKFAQ
ncbi:MAG: cysteine--tRNA ligase [Candidatus Aenigmarchaeota archaeon]|nr:cysteine--tRNA ligase [Candidatus Aenigmarchaeota archaeon]